MKCFHCFWIEPVGMKKQYKLIESEAEVLELIRQAIPAPHEYSNIADLVIIFGERVEWEPAEWVKSFKLKGSFL